MTTDEESIRRFDNIEKKLDSISNAISTMAAQRVRIDNLTEKMNAAWEKIDKIQEFQSTCPRESIKGLRYITSALTIALLAASLRLLGVV